MKDLQAAYRAFRLAVGSNLCASEIEFGFKIGSSKRGLRCIRGCHDEAEHRVEAR